jgi:hypothetical protein
MLKIVIISIFSTIWMTGLIFAANTISVSQTEGKEPSVAAISESLESALPLPISPSLEKKITLNLASRLLTIYEGDVKVRIYPVGVGKTSTPTPIGYYKVTDKEMNPEWIDPDNTNFRIESGEENPLGYRWIGLFGNYGIHGTNKPDSIGGYVSNGCIRMYEKDVENLYNMVPLGTPVEIYYDRIVIDRNVDHTISYYIYPDGYKRQPLDIYAVRKALTGYGVDNFESDENISEKINNSDGQPTFIAKAYTVVVNGKRINLKAIGKDDSVYLPAAAVAAAVKSDLSWDAEKGVLISPYGKVKGIVKNNVLYFCASDADILFRLQGILTEQLVYELNTVQSEPTSPIQPSVTDKKNNIKPIQTRKMLKITYK